MLQTLHPIINLRLEAPRRFGSSIAVRFRVLFDTHTRREPGKVCRRSKARKTSLGFRVDDLEV